MRVDVHQLHGKDHSRKPRGEAGCGCAGEPGSNTSVEFPALPPVGSNIWVQGHNGMWREMTVERYTFGDPKDASRILCWATYDIAPE